MVPCYPWCLACKLQQRPSRPELFGSNVTAMVSGALNHPTTANFSSPIALVELL
jgi:hypothetical protein